MSDDTEYRSVQVELSPTERLDRGAQLAREVDSYAETEMQRPTTPRGK